MTEETFSDYVKLLELMIGKRYTPLTVGEVRGFLYGELGVNSAEYENKRKHTQRMLDFFIDTKIFTITFQTNNDTYTVDKIIEKDYIDGKTKKKTTYYCEDKDGNEIKVKPTELMYRLFKDEDYEIDEDKKKEEKYTVGFNIPNKNISIFCQTIVSMFSTIPNPNIIYNDVIKTITQSNTFGLQTNFINNTVTNMIIKMTEYQSNDKPFNMELLNNLGRLQSKLNVNIQSDDTELNISNTKISKVVFNEDSIDVKLKNTTVTLKDISEIKSIQSFEKSDLEKDVEKLKTILSEYPNEVTKPINEFIDGYQNILDSFVF